ncbi:MAG: hypothetical protein P9M11_07120 [Candidatus Tenebribacter burtonii]|nr:hypothetical protein [Candidatus Tenebribacter burtonii]
MKSPSTKAREPINRTIIDIYLANLQLISTMKNVASGLMEK